MYIATAIAYPNGNPHIGHAYEYICADALARYHRLKGDDVFYLTGTDEHGQKILRSAQKEGISPKELVDRNSEVFKQLHAKLHSSYDRFIRTTEEEHYRTSQELWRRMQSKGDIYQDTYSGWYSTKEEAYVEEAETQLLEDGSRIHIDSGSPVEWMEEITYFFALSKYQTQLLEYYEQNPDFITPATHKNEIISFVKQGLKDISISRSTFDWGIPVPDNPEHIMYVWVDALTNYLTGIGFPDDHKTIDKFWPVDIHIIGKDVSRFHTVFWPAFLWSAGITPAKKVAVHGMVLYKGEKMSKSLGNVIAPLPLVETFGVDPIRYFFLREFPYGSDGAYSEESLLHRINSDLANDLGNLAQRCLSMIDKNFARTIPTPGDFTSDDLALLEQADAVYTLVDQYMTAQAMHLALESIWRVLGATNKYFSDQAPWTLKTTDPVRQGTILYVTAEIVRISAILLQWAMPSSTAQLLDQLAIPADQRKFSDLDQRLIPGRTLPEPYGVFPRFTVPKE